MPRALNQLQVADRLATDAKKMMRDRVEIPATNMIVTEWESVRDDVRAYAAGVWNQMNAKDNPLAAEHAKQRITAFMDEKLHMFRDQAVEILNVAKRQAFKQQFLMDHWILDQVTPPNINVKPKRNADDYKPAGGVHRKVGVKEAWYDEPTQGEPNEDPDTGQPVASHEQRVDAYVKTWEIAAFAGLAMGGIQGDSPGDIDARIGGTLADGNQMNHALTRLVSTEVQVSIGDADDAFRMDNQNLVKERRWQTMEDERVCYICKPNNGKTEAEATHNIPAHPRCRCYWRTVPVPYKDLAGGAAHPSAGNRGMAIKDPQTGAFLGTAVVDFDGWSQTLAG